MDPLPDIDTLLPLGIALAEPNLALFYGEASRQYQTLVAARDTEAGTTKIHATRAQQWIHLPIFYRNLFEEATGHLSDELRWHLMTVCFAYKVRDRVLEYFSLLGKNPGYEWASKLREVVEDCGRDSAFDRREDLSIPNKNEEELEAISSKREGNPQSSKRNFGLRSLTHRRKGESTVEKSHTDPSSGLKSSNHFFIIPTLPLAYPKNFFTVFFNHAPISHFTTSHILSHPAATQLDLTDSLEAILKKNYAAVIEPMTKTLDLKTSSPHDQDDFFAHILEKGQMQLFDPQMEMIDTDVDIQRDGYSEVDLEMWCAQWRAKRQSAEMNEMGLQEMERLKAESGTVDDEDYVIYDPEMKKHIADYYNQGRHDSEEDYIEEDGNRTTTAEGGNKRARFNEEAIAHFKEIPARPMKRKKARKKW